MNLNESPYQGYTKANLTIYVEEGGFGSMAFGTAGYNTDTSDGASKFGTLNPAMDYTQLYLNYFGNDILAYRIICTRPFYYDNVLYSASDSNEKAESLFNDWKNRNGETVTVYLKNA